MLSYYAISTWKILSAFHSFPLGKRLYGFTVVSSRVKKNCIQLKHCQQELIFPSFQTRNEFFWDQRNRNKVNNFHTNDTKWEKSERKTCRAMICSTHKSIIETWHFVDDGIEVFSTAELLQRAGWILWKISFSSSTFFRSLELKIIATESFNEPFALKCEISTTETTS